MPRAKRLTSELRVIVEPEVRTAIEKAARDQDRDISGLVRHLVRNGLREMGYLAAEERGSSPGQARKRK